MRLLAEVVPLVPAAGAIIGYLGSLLIFCLAVALTVMWVQILRGPLVRIASISILRHHPFGFLTSVVNNVDHWLKAAEQGGERGMVWSLHTLMWSFSTGAKLTRDLAHEAWAGLEWERRHTTRHVSAPIPQSIDPRIKTLEKEYKGIDTRIRDLEKREKVQRGVGAAAGTADHAQLQKGIDRLNKEVGHLAQELHGVEHAQAHAGSQAKPGSVAVPRTAPRVVPRSRPATRSWTSVLTKLGAVGLVGYALARMGLNWLRCPALLRTGKRIGCGGFSLLEELLAASFVPFILTDACKIMHLIEGIAVKVEPEIAALVLGIEGFVCGGVDNLPSGIVPGDLKRVGASASSL